MLLIEDLFTAEGTVVEVEGNKPLPLTGSDRVWLVSAGKLDVFAVKLDRGAPTGVRRHLFRISSGQILLDLSSGEPTPGIGLLARGLAGTTLIELPLARWRETAPTEQVAALLTGWINDLAAGSIYLHPPKKNRVLEAGEEIPLPKQQTARPETGVCWVQHLQGTSRFLGNPDLSLSAADPLLPLASTTWIEAVEEGTVQVYDTPAALDQAAAWPGLSLFHTFILATVGHSIAQAEQEEQARLAQAVTGDRLALRGALVQLSSVLETQKGLPPMEGGTPDPLVAACQMVGRTLNLTIIAPPGGEQDWRRRTSRLVSIAHASQVRIRQVALRPGWWQHDNGPLLAFIEETQRPVALLPDPRGQYDLYDPVVGSRTRVTEAQAATLAVFGYTFFRPFPARPIGLWDLLKFGLQGCLRDTRTVLFIGVAGGLLATVTPVATGLIFDRIIPAGSRSQLLMLVAALLVIAVVSALFQLVRGIALLRIETRLSAAVQAAVWDRLINLPMPFFRDYSAGDLATRALSLNMIRQILGGTTLTSILAGVFSIFNIMLLFYYEASLAGLAVGLVLVAVAATSITGYLQLLYERQLNLIQARVSGIVLQLVSGITKLRVAGAEERAFRVWAEMFSQQRRVEFQSRVISNRLSVFNAGFPLLSSMVLFMAIGFSDHATASTGTFLAFLAAFGALMMAALEMSSGVLSLLRIVPIFENAKPIFQTLSEVSPAKFDPGELSGRVEVNHVSFRYDAEGPLVLQDVSLHAEPGEFIAVVGPSGSGKSTILRLLLGFETPGAGSIYFDGQALAHLDIQAVRSQLGVVLQNGKLQNGDIYTNIVGTSQLTMNDAWEAADKAGLSADIKRMPMGMHTVVSEGGTTFSGGQRQRLMIARAIVTRPRILFFDEATSALDNRTQDIVSKSLETLQATRIVIAHRLSTIMNADRIYVVVSGQVVQSGTYQELANHPGPFADLVQRQLA